MKRNLKILLILPSVYVLLFGNGAFSMFLDDGDRTLEMMRKGVSLREVILPVIKEQTKSTVKNLALAAAPVYPLEKILELYPINESGSKQKLVPMSGEEAFFEDCSKDPELFCAFFHAMSQPYFLANGKHYNPLDVSQRALSIKETTLPYFNPLDFHHKQLFCINYTNLPSYFLSFQIDLKQAINFRYIQKLLETDCPPPKLSIRTKKPQIAEHMKMLRYKVPFIRGEIALALEQNAEKAWRYFSISAERQPDSNVDTMLSLHMAEV